MNPRVISLGSGPPLVLIPGIQGRWEWMRPAVQALAAELRVITFSLAGDKGSGCTIDPRLGFDNFICQLDAIFEATNLERASLAGVSYGGLIALRYAAQRPGRVTSLILISTPGPSWNPAGRVARYAQWPRLMAPLFFARSPLRLWPEIYAAHGTWRARLGCAVRHLVRVAAAPCSPVCMAARVKMLASIDLPRDCAGITSPTLVLTGERALDRVVPIDSSLEYMRAIRGAVAVTLSRTGHIGLVTRPAAFAQTVGEFVLSRETASLGNPRPRRPARSAS